MSSGRPSKNDIPNCSYCGGPRGFEFQVWSYFPLTCFFFLFLGTLLFSTCSFSMYLCHHLLIYVDSDFPFSMYSGLFHHLLIYLDSDLPLKPLAYVCIWSFQILPQLLYYFGVKNDVDSLDWATIVVYTCEASCEESGRYKEEFGWVQLASPSAAVH